MYNVPKTIPLTILLKEANRDLPREKAYVMPRVCDKIDCRKMSEIEERGVSRCRYQEKGAVFTFDTVYFLSTQSAYFRHTELHLHSYNFSTSPINPTYTYPCNSISPYCALCVRWIITTSRPVHLDLRLMHDSTLPHQLFRLSTRHTFRKYANLADARSFDKP